MKKRPALPVQAHAVDYAGSATSDWLLTDQLAVRIMRWRLAPDRFLTGNGGWTPRWRFRPTEKLEDAFTLLEAAAPTSYSMGDDGAGGFWAHVEIGGVTGEARERSKPTAITLAVARAVGIEIKGGKL